MKKGIIITVVIAVFAALIFFSVKGKSEKGEEVYTDEVKRETISEQVLASGEIRPRTYVNLQSDIIGKIIRLHFKEGDWVKKGQILVEIEKETLLRQRDQLNASLESSRAQMRRAEAAFEETRLRYERVKKLIDEKIVSQETLDQAWASFRQAQATLTSSENEVQRAGFALEELDERIKKATIHAPMSGRVVQLDMEEGELVIAGNNIPGSVIGVVADMSDILAEVDIIESEIAGVELGMSADITVDAIEDVTFSGTVEEIAHSAFKKLDVNYFKVKILLDNPDEQLRPGMSARSTVTIEEHLDALSVPIQAVVERKEKEYVFTYDEGIARKVEVKTGISDDHGIEILEGLEEGQVIITGPSRTLKDLKDEASVRIKEKDEKDEKDEDAEEETSSDEEESTEEGGGEEETAEVEVRIN